MKKIENRKSKIGNAFKGFTLIELLVVISIIGVLAAFTIPVLSQLKLAQYKRVARAELEAIQTALENYKAKYGSYPPANQNLNSAYTGNTPVMDRAQFPQLYYELAGTRINGGDYISLDGTSEKVPVNSPGLDVKQAYGVSGFVNADAVAGGGEDAQKAKNFLINLRSKQIASVSNNNVLTTALVTSIGGPDENYKPLKASNLNPVRYRYPGVNNPNGYDLWIQFKFKNKTNLVCNWSRQVIQNSPLP